MENNKLSFCYSKMKDIDVELKGNKNENSNCDGCVYFDFCLKDVAGVKTKEEKTKAKAKVKEKPTKEIVADGETLNDLDNTVTEAEAETVKESKAKKVTEAKSKKPKKKKETIEDLLDEDIF